MAHVLIVAPTEEPISLSEACEYVRVEPFEEDSTDNTIERNIRAARSHAEKITQRALCTQTWETVLDAFPVSGWQEIVRADDFYRRDLIAIARPLPIALARGKLQSVASVKYLDSSGTEQTLDPATYAVDDVTDDPGGRIVPLSSWPETAQKPNAVRVRYVCGYGGAEDVPEPIRQAILLLVSHFFDNRSPEVVARAIAKFDFTIDDLLRPYRVAMGF